MSVQYLRLEDTGKLAPSVSYEDEGKESRVSFSHLADEEIFQEAIQGYVKGIKDCSRAGEVFSILSNLISFPEESFDQEINTKHDTNKTVQDRVNDCASSVLRLICEMKKIRPLNKRLATGKWTETFEKSVLAVMVEKFESIRNIQAMLNQWKAERNSLRANEDKNFRKGISRLKNIFSQKDSAKNMSYDFAQFALNDIQSVFISFVKLYVRRKQLIMQSALDDQRLRFFN